MYISCSVSWAYLSAKRLWHDWVSRFAYWLVNITHSLTWALLRLTDEESSQHTYLRPKSRERSETQTLHAGCSKEEPKIFAPPQTPFPGMGDGQNLISWRWSLPLPKNPVWWGSMHAISSYHGNRPTNKHTHKHTHTHTHTQIHRQDRL